MTNIVKFPNKGDFPNTKEEAYERIISVRQEFADDVVADVLATVYSMIENYGIQLGKSEAGEKDALYFEDALEAMLYRCGAIPHDLHTVIDESIVIAGEPKATEADDTVSKQTKI
jgi:hypothetical protein